jgi:hypothetical protein
MGVLVALLVAAIAAAHPPEFHRARMARQGDVEREPTEADRQAAWFAFEFFTAFVGRVGSPLADQAVAQAIDEQRFATKSPGARGLADLERSRGELIARLREQHGTLRVSWDGETLASDGAIPPIDRAKQTRARLGAFLHAATYTTYIHIAANKYVNKKKYDVRDR